VYIYFAKSLRTTGVASSLWHMAFHVTSIFSWTAEIYRSTQERRCDPDPDPDTEPNTIPENSRDADKADDDVGPDEDREDPFGAARSCGDALLPSGIH
jgi:hypothetical protein